MGTINGKDIPGFDTTFHLMFNPGRWDWSVKFSHFVGVAGHFDREAIKGANTYIDHHQKFVVLGGLANRIIPDLKRDREQFAERGSSDQRYHREFCAVLEVLIAELYSSLDGIRRLIYSVYRNVQGVQNESTQKLFSRASKKAYGSGFPAELNDALAHAYETWFPGLYRIRRELTHGQTGHCHLDEKTEKITYFHQGLGSPQKSFVIEDILAELETWRQGVHTLKEKIFQHFYLKLEQKPMFQMCGIFKGRCYQRFVVPSPDLSFGDGYCGSREWFDKEPDYLCPLRNQCGAYNRKLECNR